MSVYVLSAELKFCRSSPIDPHGLEKQLLIWVKKKSLEKVYVMNIL